MLVLHRKPRETIVLHTSDGPIEITVISKHRIKLAIQAPADVKVLRAELTRRAA